MLAVVIVLIIIGLGLVVAVRQQRRPRLREWAASLLVSYGAIIALLLVGEAFFRWIHTEPDGLPTLASQNWLARYWQTNSLGYRDREWTSEELAERDRIFIVGDSFAAGWGIADPAQRFGDRLAERLGPAVAVVNLGQAGTATDDQRDHLLNYPLARPDIVIWQYYLNDIETAALSIGLDPGINPLKGVPGWAQESYLGNFLYWRLVNIARPEQRAEGSYWDWLYSMYDNSTVWDIHHRQIDAMVDAVEGREAQLVVVIFPNMLDPVGSIPYVDRVAQALAARGYASDEVLKLFDDAEAMPLRERIVSERDAHASPAFHALVAESLEALVRPLMP